MIIEGPDGNDVSTRDMDRHQPENAPRVIARPKVKVWAVSIVFRQGHGSHEIYSTHGQVHAAIRALAEECATEDDEPITDETPTSDLVDIIQAREHEVTIIEGEIELPTPSRIETAAARVLALNRTQGVSEDDYEAALNDLDRALAPELAGGIRRGNKHAAKLAEPSEAYEAEHPWCGWRLAFAHWTDADTVSSYGLTERLENINVLLTTADGKSRPVRILNNSVEMPLAEEGDDDDLCQRGIEVTELDTEHYEPLAPERRELVRYEDIREVVVF